MQNKGFIFSLEAAISVLLLGTALLTLFQPHDASFKKLVVLQQENDLLKVWGMNFPGEKEMANDAKQLFAENFELFVEGKKTASAKSQKKNCVSSEAKITDKDLKEKKILIKVYFE